MMRRSQWLSFAVLLGACTSPAVKHDAPPGMAPTGPVLPGPSRGSAVALAPDDSVAVIVNRDAGTATVMSLSFSAGAAPTAKTVAEVALGGEPWQAVISPDGNRAYVVLRKDQQLIAIESLKSKPVVGTAVAVGSEPTALALTPTGERAWVANWMDGTLTEVDTATMKINRTVDLNGPLVNTGVLGSVTARPALAHPRSLTISNNGDRNDNDESIYVTEYFAQRTQAEAADGSNADLVREGLVYRVRLADLAVKTIPLAPLADMGFKDHLNQTAGCFPNQLQSITLNGKFAYVASVCASPRGPTGPFSKGFAACTTATTCLAPAGVTAQCTNQLCSTNCASDADCEPNGGVCSPAGVCAPNPADVKTTVAALVSVIDTTTESEVTTATASLNAAFERLFATANVPDSAARRYPLMPTDIAFVPGGGVSYVSASGSDAVFRVRYDATSSAIVEVGASTQSFIDLNPAGIGTSAGESPIGVAVSNQQHDGRFFGFAANDVTRNLSILDFNTQTVAGLPSTPAVVATTALPTPGSTEALALAGKRFFNTGTGRWSLKGQAWDACQACHGDGLTDNVTWYFARGPRQTISLDATFSKKNPGNQRILNWTAIFDEIADFENNTRGISGGVGAIVSTLSTPPAVSDRIDLNATGDGGLNGSAAARALMGAQPQDWAEITAYLQNLRSPRAPTTLDAQNVAAGRTLFEGANCQGCHGGDQWTLSHLFYSPSSAASAALTKKAWAPPAGFPSLLLPAVDTASQTMRFSGANAGALDQITCVLRPVGTFGAAEPDVAQSGAFPELRVDMKTKAQGADKDGNGFNPPSLLASGIGAPYLHDGGVRTLETLFSSTFASHYAALSPNFLTESEPARSQEVAQLVQFLLSIDGDTTAETQPQQPGASGGDFCVSP
jgi:DNA-binding beta-propeller fold protein YncE